ncbi:MAG TPA: response regulator transcription factor [Acidimicrobiia bacterium]|nr:response regulator transcription factor [Acidimicrobiia bacterium]
MARVVVVEERAQPRVARLLTEEGISLENSQGTLDVVMKLVDLEAPDVIILEVVSPSRAATRLCASLQSAAARARIAIFAERAAESEVVAAYRSGADTVICEPVGSHELVARIRALLRRAPMEDASDPDLIAIGPVRLDRARRQVTVCGELVPLPRKEFDIAELLMSRAGGVVSRTQLVRELWGTQRDTKTLDVQVGRLRAKLMAAEGLQRIVTVRGVGYRFATDDELGIDPGVEPARR